MTAGILVMLSSTFLAGQDVVYLKDGSSISGDILQYVIGGNLTLETEGSTRILIPSGKIASIVDGDTVIYGKTKDKKQSKKLKERTPLASDKWYFDWENKAYVNNNDGGLGISLSYLYQWRHYLSAGVGVGYDNYNNNIARSIVPVFTQVRSYIKDAPNSPFVDVKLGYGISANNSERVYEAQGGFYGQTMAGIRFGSGGFRTTLGLGIQLQNTYLEGWHRWNSGIVKEDRQYRRLVINLGFIF